MAEKNTDGREVTFEITENIAVINTSHTGWNKELNLVSWNGGEPRFDIREWDANHERMSRGITLSDKDMKVVRTALDKRDREKGLGKYARDAALER